MLYIFIKLFLNMLVVETFNNKEIVDKIVLYSEPVSLVCSLERATYSKEGFVSFLIKP